MKIATLLHAVLRNFQQCAYVDMPTDRVPPEKSIEGSFFSTSSTFVDFSLAMSSLLTTVIGFAACASVLRMRVLVTWIVSVCGTAWLVCGISCAGAGNATTLACGTILRTLAIFFLSASLIDRIPSRSVQIQRDIRDRPASASTSEISTNLCQNWTGHRVPFFRFIVIVTT
jgi:hypothetical protein